MLKHLMRPRDERGFTLVELLVVIIIIGILAAIAIPVFLNQRQRANDASVKSDVKSVANELEGLLVENPNATTFGISEPTGNRATVNAGTATSDVPLSDGVSIFVEPSTPLGTYKVYGWHSNGKQYASEALLYDSGAGGLQTGTVALPSAPTPETGPTIPGAPNAVSNLTAVRNPSDPNQVIATWANPVGGEPATTRSVRFETWRVHPSTGVETQYAWVSNGVNLSATTRTSGNLSTAAYYWIIAKVDSCNAAGCTSTSVRLNNS